MAEELNRTVQSSGSSALFRAPQPKPGLNIAPPSFFRRLRRSIGGTIAYLASWWRY
jgi:hypothetical protein